MFDTRGTVRDETPFTGAAGERQYEYILVPILNAAGEVEAVAGSTRDVTDRKRVEDALREADRRKDEFLAMLAHELRNPLAPHPQRRCKSSRPPSGRCGGGRAVTRAR